MYDDLFTGGTIFLEKQPFFLKIKKLSNESILKLIQKNYTSMNDNQMDNKSQKSFNRSQIIRTKSVKNMK